METKSFFFPIPHLVSNYRHCIRTVYNKFDDPHTNIPSRSAHKVEHQPEGSGESLVVETFRAEHNRAMALASIVGPWKYTKALVSAGARRKGDITKP